jgi:hypothetical protein
LKLQRTLTAVLIVLAAGMSAVGWVNQETKTVNVSTNAGAVVTNGIAESGYFLQIAANIPAGLTNASLSFVDAFTGNTLLSTNGIGASATSATNLVLWSTNLMHGAYAVIASNGFATTNAAPSIQLNLLEDR